MHHLLAIYMRGFAARPLRCPLTPSGTRREEEEKNTKVVEKEESWAGLLLDTSKNSLSKNRPHAFEEIQLSIPQFSYGHQPVASTFDIFRLFISDIRNSVSLRLYFRIEIIRFYLLA